MKKRFLASLVLLALLAGCGAQRGAAPSEVPAQTPANLDFFAMDTYMNIRAYGADSALLLEAQSYVEGLEAELSTTLEDSSIRALNRSGSAVLSPDAAYLAERALALCAETGGALDVSVYPVVRAWGFTTEEYRVPAQAELDALLERVNYAGVTLSADGEIRLEPGMEIDLGSVAKGYAGDRICRLLREHGVESALLDLGGNVHALGSKPDGSDWRVGIQDPEGNGILGVLPISDAAVITSGGYERYFTDDAGNIWWHIIDPSDGYPARNGLISATVVGSEGLYCDALSTSLFIMGPDRAIAFWRAHRDFEMALVTEDGELLLTPGIYEKFTPESNLPYTLSMIQEN